MTVIEQHLSQLTNLNKKLLLQLEVSFRTEKWRKRILNLDQVHAYHGFRVRKCRKFACLISNAVGMFWKRSIKSTLKWLRLFAGFRTIKLFSNITHQKILVTFETLCPNLCALTEVIQKDLGHLRFPRSSPKLRNNDIFTVVESDSHLWWVSFTQIL